MSGDRQAVGARAPLLIAVLCLLVILGSVLAFAGLTIWPLVVAVGTGLVLCLGQFMSWTTGFVFAIAVLLLGLLAVLLLAPPLALPLGVALPTGLGVVGLAAAAAIAARRGSLRLPDARAWRGAATAAPSALVVLATAAVIAVLTNGTRLAWGMWGDAATNTALARDMWEDGGIDLRAHPNLAPLTQAMMLAVWVPGRAGLAPGEWLANDLPRTAELLVALCILDALLVSIVAVRAARRGPVWTRVAAGLIVSVIPLSWFVLGGVLALGHHNVLLAIALLVGAWLLWQDSRDHPFLAVLGLALLSLVTLAAWAPVAAVTAGLAAAVVLSHPRLFFGRPWTAPKIALVVVAAAALVGGALASVAILSSSSSSLAVDGGAVPVPPRALMLAMAVAIALGVLDLLRKRGRQLMVGATAIAVGGGVAVAYLLWERRGSAELWGYYPQKIAWILCILLLVIVASEVLGLVSALRRPWRAAGFALAAVAAVAAASITIPQNWRAQDLMRMALEPPGGAISAPADAAVQDLMAISDPPSKDLVSAWGAVDQFMNFWLILQSGEAFTEAMRHPAYFMDSDDPVELCAAIEAWGDGVTVHTRDPGLGARLDAVCPGPHVVEVAG